MTNSKKCFVLIRGLLRDARHWGEFPKLLQKKYPDALILTPDIPGSGSLYKQTSPNSIAAMTDALRTQIPTNYQVHLLTISMGGMVAIDWMHRYPDTVNSAILINTSLRDFSPFYQRLRWQNYFKIIKLLRVSQHEREPLILALTSNMHTHDQGVIKNWQRWQQEAPVSSTSAKNQLRAAASFSYNATPKQPILIISSSADRLVDYRCSLTIQQSWHKDYHQHKTAGHDLPLDDPQWLIMNIDQWLNNQ